MLAELAVATRALGRDWWQRPLKRWDPAPGGPSELDSPDAYLDSGTLDSEWVDRRSVALGWLAVAGAADAVAVAETGPPAASADLNSMMSYFYPLDVDSRPGELVSVAYDAGGRCEGVV